MRSLVGGAAVPEALIRAFAKHGIWIIQGWGMTETSPLARSPIRAPKLQDAGDDERFRRAAMAGMPVPLVDMRVRGDDGSDAPWDGKSVGEIQVRGPVHHGHLPRGAASSEDKFTDDGWLRTGDVAAMDALGFVRITDRTKDLIKSGGEWISSVDLENALMAHPAIAEAAVIAIPDENGASGRWRASSGRRARRSRRDDADARQHLLGTASPSGSCPSATSSSKPCRAPRPASSGS